MDTSDPDIVFDSKGTCNHCSTFLRCAETELVANRPDAKQQLEWLLDAIRGAGKGREYDCIIGVSGGVDSTYVACKAKEFGLRPLAVHVDNGWNSNLAVTNIQRTLQKLGIDLVTQVLDWEEFRSLQVAFLRSSTPDSEIPTDHAIQAVLLNTAARHRVRYILGGSNFATEAIMPLAWSRGIRDWKYIRSVHQLFGEGPLQSFPHFTLARFGYYHFVCGVRFTYLLNYVQYVKDDAVEFLERFLSWQRYGGKHYESIYTRFFQGYILPTKFGYDKRRGHFSTLICSGQLTREQALEALKKPPCPPAVVEQDREFVLKKLKLGETEFAKIMSAVPRTFYDYPSYERGRLYRPAVAAYQMMRRAALAKAQRKTHLDRVLADLK